MKNGKEVTFKRVYTIRQIKMLPFVDQVFKDSDGWWLHFKRGYVCPEMECGTIHEQTVKDLAAMLNLHGVETINQ